MTAPIKPYETVLQNNGQFLRRSMPNPGYSLGSNTGAPPLPPRPQTGMSSYGGGYNSYSPYSSYGSGGYNNYGGMSSYGSMPYRSYGGMGGYGSTGYGMGGGFGMGGSGYGMGGSYGMGGAYGTNGVRDDAESRFIQFAEESSRNTFANVESIIRAFSSMAMMLDNTFFAMTSSFRAVLGVAENFGRLRSMFGHIWHAVNIFRLFNWLYRKLTGAKVPASSKTLAWNEAANGAIVEGSSGGSSWPTLAFIGAILSAPYLISKLLPKYEDKLDPEKWKSIGIPAKAAFEFASSSSNELSLHINDEIVLAPKAVQEEMKMTNSGWAYATCNGRTGVVPLNYIVIMKKPVMKSTENQPLIEPPPIPRNSLPKPQKRVSFGENQIFESSEHILNKISEIDKKEPEVETENVIIHHDESSPEKEAIQNAIININDDITNAQIQTNQENITNN